MKLFEHRFFVPAALFLLCAAVYGGGIGNGFHWEDEVHVEKNVHIRTLKNLPVFFKPGYINVYESGLGQRYRPLRTVTLALDYKLWGLDPRGYHLTNMLLHFAVCLALWLLLKAAGLEAAGAFFAAALFAVHPIHAESIAYIKNRSDLICAFFSFGSLFLFASYLKTGNRQAYGGAVASAALAFLSKEMALALPLAAAGLYFTLRPSLKDRAEVLRAGAALGPFFLLLGVYWLFKKFSMGGASAEFPGSSWDQAWTVIRTLGSYLKLLFFPLKLSLDHNFPLYGPPDALSVLLLGASAVYFAWALKKGRRTEAFWTGLLFLLLAPVSNLVYIQGRSFAEQRAYLPSAAFCALLGLWLSAALRSGRPARLGAAAAAFLAVVLLAGRGVARNADWKDDLTLWRKTAATDPSARSFYNLSVTLYRRNDYSGAIGAAQKSIELDPRVPDGYNTLGSIYFKMGLLGQSEKAFEKGLSLSDNKEYVTLSNLASVYGAMGRHEEAVRLYLRAVGLAPWFDAGFYNMSLSLEKLGRPAEAERALAEALALNPYNADAHMKLAQLFAARGDKDGAARLYGELLQKAPGHRQAALELDKLSRP